MTHTTCPQQTQLKLLSLFRVRIVLVFATLFWIPATYLEAAGLEVTILKSSDLKAYNDAIDGFKATSPGSAIFAEYDLRGDLERGKQLAKRVRTSESSLVVAVGLKAALAAKLEIEHIPILYMMILDPFKHHLTANNMTGVLLEISPDRQMKIMRSFLPNLRRVGMLYDPEKTSDKLKEVELRAPAQDFQVQGFPVTHEKDIPQQLRTLLSESDALWLIPDSTVLSDESIRFILESAVAHHVPVIGFSSEFTRLGALLSFSVDYGEVGREAGLLAKRLLNGDPPQPLKPIPVQRIRITVNQKTARYLGITIPRELEKLIDETY
ncbi:MAG TPA: ABC transporter substrate-binding protein [Nitrospira sp.]|nr:ABC transporter substrate-binding protein [Nitrospira sp.]